MLLQNQKDNKFKNTTNQKTQHKKKKLNKTI